MDHHHRPWHQRPIQGNNSNNYYCGTRNICPVCSISHFPFCPPPHHVLNPRFPVPPPPNFTQDVNSPNLIPYSNDGRYLSNPNPYFVNDNSGYTNGSGLYNAAGHAYSNKRMRVDEMGYSVYNHQSSPYSENSISGSFAGEDERRLQLIRDHGTGFGRLPQGGGLYPELSTNANYNHERGGYNVLDAVAARSFSGNGTAQASPSNGQLNNTENLGCGSVDRKGPVLHPETGSNLPVDRNGHFVSSIHNGHMTPNVKNSNRHVPLTNNSQLRAHSAWQASGVAHQGYRNDSLAENYIQNPLPHPYAVEHPINGNHNVHLLGKRNDRTQWFEGHPLKIPMPNSMVCDSSSKMHASPVNDINPPLPMSPPPPLPPDPPSYALPDPNASYAHSKVASLPFGASSNASLGPTVSSYPPVPEGRPLAQPYLNHKTHFPSPNEYAKDSHIIQKTSQQFARQGQQISNSQRASDKPEVVDASLVFKRPHRATRPDHIAVILRGLPGSGKSYLAKMLRDIELENGGDAPRIHSMDDYFMTEVEKVEEGESAKSSSSGRSRKPITKKVMEYCYEPEMEEAYRSSMLKAFKKTVEEGVFTFVIVDDRNLRVADFAQFWATAKRSGYEVYLLEAPYKDPVGCTARNVHNFTQAGVCKMAQDWEETPSLYLQLDVKSLFHGDNLKESGIQEVDMDMEDGTSDEGISALHERLHEKANNFAGEDAGDGPGSAKEKGRVANGDADYHGAEGVKELGRSKWSDDADEGDTRRTKTGEQNMNTHSGHVQVYSKQRKSVHWGDKVSNTGFSIAAAKKTIISSLVIGPGSGYNLKSNPLPEEGKSTSSQSSWESRRESIFQEQLRAERESFKVIFDKRRQRIGGLDVEDE